MTNAELIAYYVNLLILQYRGKPKAEATVALNAEILTIYELIKSIEAGYNINIDLGPTAIGAQLDIVAKYAGASRVVSAVDFTRIYFGTVEYAESTPYSDLVAGVISYTELSPPDAQMLEYKTDERSMFSLTDPELLIIIKLRIAQNNSNHSNKEIDIILNNFLGDQVIFTDEQNMTISYIFDEQVARIAGIAEAIGALPKPAAVGLIVSYVPDITNIFGMLKYAYDTPADFVEGMVLYANDPFGSFLRY